MKKLFKNFGLGFVALVLSLSLATNASAALTLSALAVDSAAGDALTIGASNTTGTIALGVANTGGITIGNGATIKTISIGSGAAVNTINIGTGAAANVITIGSTTGAASLALKAGSGGVVITGVLTATSPVFTTPALGVATATSVAIGGGTALTKITVASLADDASGWVPDGTATDFTITASAASIAATSHITVSVGTNATAAACGVYTKTAATSFKVKCSAAPANAATLEYMIVN